ncbi:MAG TPA: type II secretion system protein GspG [Enhygromyxa sp.]|nr:type II secretion system protein GspG [Enhygromyxa sp.]
MQATAVPFRLHRCPNRSQRGMSLIEILVVLAIIALLSTGVAILANKAWVRSQTKIAAKEVAVLSQAVEAFQLERGRCPKDTRELVSEGIIKQLKGDPWGTPYAFTCPGEHAEFDIASAGKDREFGTDDDVTSWALDAERRASAE